MDRQTFREFYAERFHRSGEGQHWAGSPGELMADVNKRMADALADYADYVANLTGTAKQGTSAVPSDLQPLQKSLE
jgi:broad specificity phosphatase PhoE